MPPEIRKFIVQGIQPNRYRKVGEPVEGYVPYTGAIADVNLGVHKVTANGTIIDEDITLKSGKKLYFDG